MSNRTVKVLPFIVILLLGLFLGAYPASEGGFLHQRAAGSTPAGILLAWLTPYLGFLALPALVAASVAVLSLALMMLALFVRILSRKGKAKPCIKPSRCYVCQAPVSGRSRTCPRCGARLGDEQNIAVSKEGTTRSLVEEMR